MNAQLKPNEQAALEFRLSSRRADQFEVRSTPDGVEGLKDELQETLDLYFDTILANHATGDDLANGVILANCIAAYAMHLTRQRQKRELTDAFLPSWRSRSEP
jgi:hypothetical protein